MATYILISTTTLTSAASTISFTSIPQTYTDLMFLTSLRTTSATQRSAFMKFNSTTANYNNIYIETSYTSGSASSYNPSAIYVGLGNPSGFTANTFTSGRIYISKYSSSLYKSVNAEQFQENNASSGPIGVLIAGKWENTAAITSIDFSNDSSITFASGSTISLYGISNA